MSKPAVPAARVQPLGPHTIGDEVRALNTAIVGTVGSGKSAAARAGWVEPLLASGRRVCIIDPTGVWWGLRFWPDGRPAFRVPIAGGVHADIDLEAPDGAALAGWLAESDGSLIVDLSEMLIGDRHRFATDFFATLYQANRRPLVMVIDEADEFAPQNPLPETRRLLHQVDRMVRRGRVRGFRVLLVTQRPAVLHKNVLSQSHALVAMRLSSPQDRKAVLEWIKGQADATVGASILAALPGLAIGSGFLWAPSLELLTRGPFEFFKTYDSSATPSDDRPAVGPPGPFPWAGEFGQIEARLRARRPPGDATKGGRHATKGRAHAPHEPVHATPAPVRETIDVTAIERAAEQRGRLEERAAIAERLQLCIDEVNPTVRTMAWFIERVHAEISAAARMPAPAELRVLKTPAEQAEKGRRNRAAGVQPAGRALLGALARSPRPLPWLDVCVIAGMSYGNGYFYGGRRWLLDEGLVSDDGREAVLTDKGRRQAGATPGLPTLAEVLETWSAKVRPPGGQMLRTIAAVPDEAMTTASLARAIGKAPGNGYWYGGVKSLRNAGLIEQDRDTFRLSPFVREIAGVRE